MTFDINSRMSQWSAAGRAQHTGETEAILKTSDSFFEERGQGGEPVARYDLHNIRNPRYWEYLRNTELWPGDKYFIDRLKLAQKTKGDSVLGSLAMLPWVHPMMSQEATEAREADLQGKKSETEKEEGEGESEKKTENEEKTESFKDSFNIDARMKQWDAANKAQHNGETERILKAGGATLKPGAYGEHIEPDPYSGYGVQYMPAYGPQYDADIYTNPDDPSEEYDEMVEWWNMDPEARPNVGLPFKSDFFDAMSSKAPVITDEEKAAIAAQIAALHGEVRNNLENIANNWGKTYQEVKEGDLASKKARDPEAEAKADKQLYKKTTPKKERKKAAAEEYSANQEYYDAQKQAEKSE